LQRVRGSSLSRELSRWLSIPRENISEFRKAIFEVIRDLSKTFLVWILRGSLDRSTLGDTLLLSHLYVLEIFEQGLMSFFFFALECFRIYFGLLVNFCHRLLINLDIKKTFFYVNWLGLNSFLNFKFAWLMIVESWLWLLGLLLASIFPFKLLSAI